MAPPKPTHAVFVVAILLVAVGALGLRGRDLVCRPMHVDEAVQALKTGDLLERGFYRYDPNEFHGPTLYYATLPILWLGGVRDLAAGNERHFRLVPVVFGVGLIVLLLLVGDGLGRAETLCAAALTAVSPAMVYYSGFYIQEMLLVCATFGALGAGWRWMRTRRLAWAIAAGAAVGLMHATKETCLLSFAAMAIAGAVVLRTTGCHSKKKAWHIVAALAATVAVSVAFYSSFGTHARGPLDSLLAYAGYLRRVGGEGTAGLHRHPPHYYLGLLVGWRHGGGPWWSEGLIVGLAALGAARALGPGGARRPFVRFLAVYTIALAAMVSLIPYKTPWTMLSAWHGAIVLAGVGAAGWIRATQRRGLRVVLVAALMIGVVHLAFQARRATEPRWCASPRNPYVYAQATHDVVRLGERIEALAAVHPDGRAMTVAVVAPEVWPLPWYLRRLTRVGWWSAPPETPLDAPVRVVSPVWADDESVVGSRNDNVVEFYGLRPGVLVSLRIERDLWNAFFERGGSATQKATESTEKSGHRSTRINTDEYEKH